MWKPVDKPPARPWHGGGRHAYPAPASDGGGANATAQYTSHGSTGGKAPPGGRSELRPRSVDNDPDYAQTGGATTANLRDYGQVPTKEKLTSLISYVVQLGGDESILDGWSALRYYRGVSARANKSSRGGELRHGDSYLVFVDPMGKQYRSKVQVGRALNLLGPADEFAAAGGTATYVKRKRYDAECD